MRSGVLRAPRDTPAPSAGSSEAYELPPSFEAIRTNVTRARHCSRVATTLLERIDRDGEERPPQSPTETTGQPSQTFAFPRAPVLDARVSVGTTAWEAVDDTTTAGPDDRVYALDRAAGTVTFGDGRQGAIPDPGQPVIATEVRYGGGEAGNLPRGSTWTIEHDTPIRATPLARPTGGRDAEPIPAAFERARTAQETASRAITAADYRDLAMRTPGVRVARAEAVATTDDGDDVPNAVTVVVVPFGRPGEQPMPTRGFLEVVECQLAVHSLLTDRVTVVPPTYVGVRVRAEVRTVEGVSDEEARTAVEERLDTFIDPIEGFDGTGWPFDRPVYRSDLFDELARLESIDDVVDVTISRAAEAELASDPTSVPYLRGVSVHVHRDRETCGRGI